MQGKQMFKVISPIEKRNGERYWMRCGTGFTNKDDSINMYIDALPIAVGKELTLQLRALTEEDLRAKPGRTLDLPRSAGGVSNLDMRPGMSNLDSMPASAAHEPVPF